MSDDLDITRLLAAHRRGDADAMGELLRVVYPELKTIARRLSGPGDQTLDATSLINELYLRLVADRDRRLNDRVHFFALAARAMRQIAVDYARQKQRKKRGGDVVMVQVDDERDAAIAREAETMIALEQAMNRIEAHNPTLPRVVECRFFGGLSVVETAQALGISERSVERYWKEAKGLLRAELSGD